MYLCIYISIQILRFCITYFICINCFLDYHVYVQYFLYLLNLYVTQGSLEKQASLALNGTTLLLKKTQINN